MVEYSDKPSGGGNITKIISESMDNVNLVEFKYISENGSERETNCGATNG